LCSLRSISEDEDKRCICLRLLFDGGQDHQCPFNPSQRIDTGRFCPGVRGRHSLRAKYDIYSLHAKYDMPFRLHLTMQIFMIQQLSLFICSRTTRPGCSTSHNLAEVGCLRNLGTGTLSGTVIGLTSMTKEDPRLKLLGWEIRQSQCSA